MLLPQFDIIWRFKTKSSKETLYLGLAPTAGPRRSIFSYIYDEFLVEFSRFRALHESTTLLKKSDR